MTATLSERLHTERRCRAARYASPDSLALLEQAERVAYEREHLRSLARHIRDTKRGKELHRLLSDLVQYALGGEEPGDEVLGSAGISVHPRHLIAGSVQHRVLSVASLTPMTLSDLFALVRERYPDEPDVSAHRNPAGRLMRRGFLRTAGARPTGYRPAALYVITPEGQAELARLNELEHGRTAA